MMCAESEWMTASGGDVNYKMKQDFLFLLRDERSGTLPLFSLPLFLLSLLSRQLASVNQRDSIQAQKSHSFRLSYQKLESDSAYGKISFVAHVLLVFNSLCSFTVFNVELTKF